MAGPPGPQQVHATSPATCVQMHGELRVFNRPDDMTLLTLLSLLLLLLPQHTVKTRPVIERCDCFG